MQHIGTPQYRSDRLQTALAVFTCVIGFRSTTVQSVFNVGFYSLNFSRTEVFVKTQTTLFSDRISLEAKVFVMKFG
jgi:hypothetical protein